MIKPLALILALFLSSDDDPKHIAKGIGTMILYNMKCEKLSEDTKQVMDKVLRTIPPTIVMEATTEVIGEYAPYVSYNSLWCSMMKPIVEQMSVELRKQPA